MGDRVDALTIDRNDNTLPICAQSSLNIIYNVNQLQVSYLERELPALPLPFEPLRERDSASSAFVCHQLLLKT